MSAQPQYNAAYDSFKHSTMHAMYYFETVRTYICNDPEQNTAVN